MYPLGIVSAINYTLPQQDVAFTEIDMFSAFKGDDIQYNKSKFCI